MEPYRILCFGDSNTWGFNPANCSRFPSDVRWTGVLQRLLGEGYLVIEEGQNGRTIATDDPAEGEKNGLNYIRPCMETHNPFDLLILMLGTNDLKQKFNYPAIDIGGEMQQMLEKIRAFTDFRTEHRPAILLVAPPHVGAGIETSPLNELFGGMRSRLVSMELASWYRQLAGMFDCDFWDASTVAEVSTADSIHMDAENHRKFAEYLADYIRNR